MIEPTPEELVRQVGVYKALRILEQRSRLAGWQEARKACLKECKQPAYASAIYQRIAALTPPVVERAATQQTNGIT